MAAGQGEQSCSTAGARFRPACAFGATGGGEPGLRCRQPQYLAHRRSSREAQASSRGTRMGRNAGTDRLRRYRDWKARALGSSRLAWWRIYHAGHSQDRYSAGSSRALADRAAGDAVRRGRGACSRKCQSEQRPRQAPPAAENSVGAPTNEVKHGGIQFIGPPLS